MIRVVIVVAALALSAASAVADDVELATAWVRATPGAAANGVAYLTVANRGAKTAIVGAETMIAKSASPHSHIMDGDIMRMRPVASVPLPRDATAVFDDGATRTVDVAVGKIGAMKAPSHQTH